LPRDLEYESFTFLVRYLLERIIRIRYQDDLVDQLFNGSQKQLARVLLLMAHFGKEGAVDIPVSGLSQGTLAKIVGTTRSRVRFFMNRFRKLGFIRSAQMAAIPRLKEYWKE
jgi:CRP/FNR family cyclic AMP-dependent transcriptional regulator